MGFNLGAFASGVAKGIPEGSRLSTERQQRELRGQQIDENTRLSEQRELLKNVVSDLYGPRADTPMPQGGESLGPRAQTAIPDQLQQTFNATNVGTTEPKTTAIPTGPETKQSWFDQKFQSILSAGLDPEYVDKAMGTLQSAAQMRIRGLGGDLQMAIMNHDKELASRIANEISNLTPGDREDITLPYKDDKYVDPRTGETIGDEGAMAAVQGFLGNLDASFAAKMAGKKAALEERKATDAESRTAILEKQTGIQSRLADQLGEVRIAMAAEKWSEVEKNLAGIHFGATGAGLTDTEIARRKKEIDDYFFSSDRFVGMQGAELAELKGLAYGVMATRGQYAAFPASTGAEVALMLKSAVGPKGKELDLQPIAGSDEYMVDYNGQPVFIKENAIRMHLPTLELPQRGTQQEGAIPTDLNEVGYSLDRNRSTLDDTNTLQDYDALEEFALPVARRKSASKTGISKTINDWLTKELPYGQ